MFRATDQAAVLDVLERETARQVEANRKWGERLWTNDSCNRVSCAVTQLPRWSNRQICKLWRSVNPVHPLDSLSPCALQLCVLWCECHDAKPAVELLIDRAKHHVTKSILYSHAFFFYCDIVDHYFVPTFWPSIMHVHSTSRVVHASIVQKSQEQVAFGKIILCLTSV